MRPLPLAGDCCARAALLGGALLLVACMQSVRAPEPPSLLDAAPSVCAPVSLEISAKFEATAFDSGLPTGGQWRDGFDLADMNGDGVLDLLHGPPRKGRPQPVIFLGDGKGRFTFWDAAHFPPLPYDYGDAKAADFNSDGRMDMALSSHLRGVVVLINEAGGHYAPWGEGLGLRLPDEPGDQAVFSSRSIAAADWNGDGKPDLLASNEGPARFAGGLTSSDALAVYLNRDGHWQRITPARSLHGFGDALAVGDVNGDGRLDAMLGTQVSGARLLLQIGDRETWSPRELRTLPRDAAVTAVALHDLDGDGRDDVVHGSRAIEGSGYCSALQAILMRADGESALALWSEASRDPVVAIVFGDIDRDGHDDLLAVRQHGGILSFAGDDNGFRRDANFEHPATMAGCSAFDAKLADLDKDGHLELLVSYAGEASNVGASGCASRGGFQAWHLRGN